MAVGIDLDTEVIQRTGLPSGGAGTLSDGGFANCGVGVWLYRPTSGNSYGLTSDGCILHFQAGAREVKLGYDNTFGAGTAADPLLQVIYNSGGGAGTPATFASANFLDEWVFYFIYEASATQNVGYIRLSAPNTVVKLTRANDNAGSQYINTLSFGNHASAGTAVFGHYAYARAKYASGLTDSDIIAWAASSAPIAGDWGFWPLANNTDTGDDSGNARDLTFTGTLTSESDPSLAGPPPTVTSDPVNQRVKAGATASFSAAATDATSQQWQSFATGSWVDISGETSTSYTTGTLAAGVSYAVRCGFTNTNGTTYTAPASVWTPVVAPPPWEGIYGAGGRRGFVRANALLPTSDTVGTIYSNALFGAASGGASAAVGASAGAATAAATGAATKAGVGASAGTAAPTAVGQSTAASAASSAGVATAAATGQAVVTAVGASAGAATAAAVGAATSAAVGSDAGVATAAAAGAATSAAVGSDAAVATAAAVGAATAAAVGATAGVAAATAVGQGSGSTQTGDGASAGTATVAAVGTAIIPAVAASSAAATATAVGAASATAVGAASAAATAAATGRATAAASASSAGVATAAAVGQSTASSAGASAGVAAATGTGAATATTVGSSAGVATATAVGQGIASGSAVGTSAGAATVAATGRSTNAGAGASAGSATATATGGSTNAGAGSSTGVATATGAGTAVRAAVGATSAAAVAAAVGAAVSAAVATASGSAAASASSAVTLATVGIAIGASTAEAFASLTISAVGLASGSSTATADTFDRALLAGAFHTRTIPQYTDLVLADIEHSARTVPIEFYIR